MSFPHTVIVFLEIVQRLRWLSPPSTRHGEKIRKRVNRAVAKFLQALGIISFRHVELEGNIKGLYRGDGIHLSDIGLDIFNTNLSTCVEMATVWGVGDRWC